MKIPFSKNSPTRSWLLASFAAALLSACGGTSEQVDSVVSNTQAAIATGTTTIQTAATQIAQPTFHLAPVLLDAPDGADAINNASSAHNSPRTQVIPREFEGMPTRGLTVQSLKAARLLRSADIQSAKEMPMAGAGSYVTTYTPAQIRAAYGLPALPAAGTTLTAAQAAQLGAGQTIYLIDAMSDPNIVTELAAFNQTFGLPACTTQKIPSSASLPLAAAPVAGCVFSVVNSTSSGGIANSAPAYDSGWAMEIALDVQWAHATAPMARIILINAPSASNNDLLGAIALANSLGPGCVSMSFGATEGSWTAAADSAFTNSSMTYLSAAGDSGPSVQWPAVSPNVVAVGGTTLAYSGTGPRSEVTWSDTGGGISQYTPVPNYQSSVVPGMGSVAYRSVSDVAFNADPNSGQYVAILSPGSTTVSWGSIGGTSLGTPQWAGIFAVANAMRALSTQPAIGDPHTVLYSKISTVPGTYASEFDDITFGSDGRCSTCSARVGYDQVTGLGSPNVASLLSTLALTTPSTTAPIVTSANVSGVVGTALSFTVSVTDNNPVTYALTGTPTGMSINSAGTVTWATPVAGTYPVTVTATDTVTGSSGQGIYTVVIASPAAPQVASANLNGSVGTALSYTVSVTDANPVTFALTGAPSGMSINSAGTVTWTAPVSGTYAVTVTAKDTKTGLSGQGVLTITISAVASGPVISARALTGVAGKPLTGTFSLSDPGASWLKVNISGVPIGMMFSNTGLIINIMWARPVTGTYSLKVTVLDSAGRSAQATIPVTITAH